MRSTVPRASEIIDITTRERIASAVGDVRILEAVVAGGVR